MLFLGMTVVPVPILVGVCPLVTVLCQEGDAILLSHFQTRNFSHLEFSKSTITIDPRNRFKAMKENMTLRQVLYLRGLELLIFQCCFYFHEFTQ